MSLLTWLKKGNLDAQQTLPKSTDAVKYNITAQNVEDGNEEVLKILSKNGSRKRKAENYTYSEETRAKIAKHALQHGVMSAKRKFSKDLDMNINESTVRYMRDCYKKRTVILKKSVGATPETIQEAESFLPKEKLGRPLKLGEDLDSKVKGYIHALRDSEAVVNTAIVMGSAIGIVKGEDPNLMSENGGAVTITNDWAKSLLKRKNMVKRKASTSARTLPENFSVIEEEFLKRISDCVSEHSIPDNLIINFDQTGIKFIPCGDWTMDTEGAKCVEVAGLNDKRMLTAVVASTASADMFPTQLIHAVKTERCRPEGVQFPASWHVTQSDNHWSANITMMGYAEKILIPYVERVRDEIPLAQSDQQALIILDMFKCHQDKDFLKKLNDNGISEVCVPPNCTDALQPQDVCFSHRGLA